MNEQSNTVIRLGSWSKDSIDSLLASGPAPTDAGQRISFISERFLGTPYKEGTLIGNEQGEQLVVNLAEIDCFTFLDYVEALRRSRSFEEFIDTIRQVRYCSGAISYSARNHFFTDWIANNAPYITDVTEEVGGTAVRTIRKQLNKKDDGTAFVPGLPIAERDITYLPVRDVYRALDRLRNGDYIGFYSPLEGLDVSHTGIVLENYIAYRLRHASSQDAARKVVDQDLITYLNDRPGVIILRPH